MKKVKIKCPSVLKMTLINNIKKLMGNLVAVCHMNAACIETCAVWYIDQGDLNNFLVRKNQYLSR